MSEENNIEATATEAPEANEPVALGVADLQNAAQIIDAAVSRGAFKAGEAAGVGAVYNKIVAFVQQVAEQQAAQQAAANETEAAASE